MAAELWLRPKLVPRCVVRPVERWELLEICCQKLVRGLDCSQSLFCFMPQEKNLTVKHARLWGPHAYIEAWLDVGQRLNNWANYIGTDDHWTPHFHIYGGSLRSSNTIFVDSYSCNLTLNFRPINRGMFNFRQKKSTKFISENLGSIPQNNNQNINTVLRFSLRPNHQYTKSFQRLDLGLSIWWTPSLSLSHCHSHPQPNPTWVCV